MVNSIVFSVIKKHDFTINYKSLYDLYQPIIGNDAVSLYITLLHESDKLSQMGVQFNNLSSLYNQLNLSYESFVELRSKLEAFQLLRTYIDNENKKYYFELVEPVSFKEFVNNQKFRHILLQKIGQANYERLEYLYSNNHLPKSSLNISVNFDHIFRSADLQKIYEFNFNQLYENISKKTHQVITLNEQVKDLINFFFNSYSLNLAEIEHCIYNAVIQNQNKQFEVDYSLLQIAFKKYIDEVNNVDVFKQIKINRNSKMFFDSLDEEELFQIFNSYQSLNSEQYYHAIKKTNLTEDEMDTINTLRNFYHLDDSLINLMIDFSLNKTHGNLNPSYLYKMAKTANACNLLDIKLLYQYLTTKKQTSRNKNIDVSNQQKINDDWTSLFNE